MQRRQTESTQSLTSSHECDDPNLNMEDVLTHLSFIRINIDSIALPEGNPLIERLFQEGSLYGFNLEYQFPCLENVSRSLRAPVRIPAKSFTMTNIQFRHRRVVLVQLAAEIIPLWKRSQLVVRLHVQLNTRGKFSTRLLAHCVVPLTELVTPPFLICRDFNFVPEKGMQFEGTSLIRIDLGTREKKLNEKLSEMRNPVLESTYVVDDVSTALNARESNVSRTGSNIPYHSQANENRPPSRPSHNHPNNTQPKADISSAHYIQPGPMPFRERLPSNLTDTSDSVFEDRSHAYAHNAPNCSNVRRLPAMELHREFRPAVRSSVSSGSRERERESPRRKSFIQLTVHEARGLPLVLDERNRFVSPNAYVSVLGRDGELRSAVCEQSRRPLWNWTARFCICGERRNIIVKIFHHDISGDQTLGFVSIPLPIEEAHRADYEMVDLTRTTSSYGEVPIITMSVDASEVIARSGSSATAQSSSSPWREPLQASAGPSSHMRSFSSASSGVCSFDNESRITATREELEEKLRRNLDDLDRLIRGIKE